MPITIRTATNHAAGLLSGPEVPDAHFYEVTALLATRFDPCGPYADLRYDREAPGLLFDWFDHAAARVPDLRVWDLTCQVNGFFAPESGLTLPTHWPWDARERLLDRSHLLRSRPEWVAVFEQALRAPDPSNVRALACCAAQMIGRDPFPATWGYLREHVDDGMAWCLVEPDIDEQRLPDYLALARAVLMPDAAADAGVRRSTMKPSSRDPHAEVWHEVLCLLERFLGAGLELIERGLRSDDLHVRYHAADVIGDWPPDRVPLDTMNLIRELARSEDDELVRARLEGLAGAS